MLGNSNAHKESIKTTYLSAREGKFVVTTGEHKGEEYDYIDGNLLRIEKRIRQFGTEAVPYFYVDMADSTTGERYTLTFPYSSGVFKSLLLSLASSKSLSTESVVRIDIYRKGEFTKLVVWEDGLKLDWVTKELPPVKSLNVGGKRVIDDRERMAKIESYIPQVNNLLRA